MRGDRAVEFAGVGKGAQPGEVVRRKRLPMPRDGIGGQAVERLGAAAPGDGVVVVARENDDGRLADERQGLGGKGAVADDVAEADDAIDAIPRGVGQDAAKGLDVRVDVGDGRVSHDGALSSCLRGCGGQDMRAVTCVMVRTSAGDHGRLVKRHVHYTKTEERGFGGMFW